ncbi:AMP-binding protein [Vibrio sp. 1CM8B]|uniref:AMP-binding protein n=1 Tax=Vibrio sp. 1CM8B TaxID=2929167 RepID=UPI0020C0EA42|nr:AMP-binding protein [Vibrio sp. 1CM8B]MCK8087062.1 AMP-binding protein [Vibrio sp. 1CM8B]
MTSNFWNLDDSVSNNTAVITESDCKITYEQLQKDIQDFSKKLPKTRSFVFLLVDNTYVSLVSYLSCLYAKQPFLLIDLKIEQGLLDTLLMQYNPNILVKFGNIQVLHSEVFELYPDLAMMISTSGTTGSPKLVRLSYNNLASNARSIVDYLGISDSEVAITTLPMSYSYGLSIINSHLLARATIVLNDFGVITRDFWAKIQNYSVTSFAGVPYVFQMLKRLKYTRFDTSSIRYITQAGGKLDSETIEYFLAECSALKQRFVVMYGQTEASPRISYVPPQELASKVGSIGIAIPEGELYLIDSTGKRVYSPHVEGEIVYRGANVMLGYAETTKDLALADEQKGLLKTGDLGYFDEDGYFFVTGRAKRFIKLFGLRIGLDSIDYWLSVNSINAVSTGSDDKLFICFEGENHDFDEVKRNLAKKFKLNINVIQSINIKNIPRKNGGKVDFKILNNMILELN